MRRRRAKVSLESDVRFPGRIRLSSSEDEVFSTHVNYEKKKRSKTSPIVCAFISMVSTVMLVSKYEIRPSVSLRELRQVASKVTGRFSFAQTQQYRYNIYNDFRTFELQEPPPLLEDYEPDFGGLEILSSLNKDSFERRIHHFDGRLLHEERENTLDQMDDANIESGGRVRDMYDEIDSSTECQPLKWHDNKYQVCNVMHEQYLDLSNRISPSLQYTLKTLGQGYYRQGLLLRPVGVDGPPLVLKMLHFFRPLNQRQVIKINNEALLMERFTSAPTITKTYGHCGTSILVEEATELAGDIVLADEDKTWRGFISNEELNRLELENGGVRQFNQLEPHDKLDIAISMAESIALLHGNPEGAVAYDDLSLDQWMLSSDGRVMLNDLNSVIPLQWNRSAKDYCTFQSRSGNFKSPEYYDYAGKMTEQSDIFPMGHMLFVLLTGKFREEIVLCMMLK